jgi:hypothetical protein
MWGRGVRQRRYGVFVRSNANAAWTQAHRRLPRWNRHRWVERPEDGGFPDSRVGSTTDTSSGGGSVDVFRVRPDVGLGNGRAGGVSFRCKAPQNTDTAPRDSYESSHW